MSEGQIALTVLMLAGVTYLTRLLPFLLFPEGRRIPPFIRYLGRVLPFAIIGMLVVYCLKSVSFLRAPFGAPEALAIAFITLVHIWKNNLLLSIGGGTVVYMLLVQVVFA